MLLAVDLQLRRQELQRYRPVSGRRSRRRHRIASIQLIQTHLNSHIRPAVGLVDSAETVVDITTVSRSLALLYTTAARCTMRSRMSFISETRSRFATHILFQSPWARFSDRRPSHAVSFAVFTWTSEFATRVTTMHGSKLLGTF